jgi:hypothetical protein
MEVPVNLELSHSSPEELLSELWWRTHPVAVEMRMPMKPIGDDAITSMMGDELAAIASESDYIDAPSLSPARSGGCL